MTAFFIWYFIITLLGWLTFPLMHFLFSALKDRGYALSRAAGLLLWAYIFWLFASLGMAQNDTGGILLALMMICGASGLIIVNRKSEIIDFLRSNISFVIASEILFLAAFAFLAFARAANPELYSTEKPMELAFISGILRSPAFPPQDPWLSGYSISYYYFGYVMTAMLARLSNITPSMAHTLMTALIFGLAAVGAYGVLYNLLSKEKEKKAPALGLSFLAPIFLLFISNLEALLEVLHRLGIFWKLDPVTQTYSSPFWTWLDMKELSQPPMLPFAWIPDRYLWWWRASRVIQDYDLTGSPREVIDEFPFFSFLLGDLHPHVLAIPFGLLAAAWALNIFMNQSNEKVELFGWRLHLGWQGFLFSALLVGGLAFLNTWDILFAGSLIVFAYVFSRAHREGWRWERIEDALLFGIPLLVVSIFLYIPFYLGFSSQAGGILPNLMFITRGAHLWVMWGTLFIPIFAYLFYISVNSKKINSHPNWEFALFAGFTFPFALWVLSWAIGFSATYLAQDDAAMFLASQGMNASQFFTAASLRRLEHIASLITLLAVFIPALAFLFTRRALQPADESSPQEPSAHHFILSLTILGAILVIAPEFVYLRDQFGYRINTIFKFYYQAWMLWSLVAAFGTAYLFQNLKTVWNILFRALMALVIFIGLLYPVFGLLNKTNDFKPLFGFTLDDLDRIRRENPDEAAAIDFLWTVPNGVIAEAVGDGYSSYARISAHTGLQAVLGWPGHEAQWRGSYEPQGSRRDDMTKLYSTARWEETAAIIQKYNIRYIYIGTLEQTSMRINEEKFKNNLKIIFQQGSVTIYETP